jgi:hypothetical protein
MQRIAVFLAASALAAAQWVNYPTLGIPRNKDGKVNLSAPAPKASDGKPDLSGMWQAFVSVRGTDGELLPQHFIDITREAQPPVVMESWAEALFKERRSRFDADDPQAHCKPLGVPRLDTSPIPIKIVQTPGLVLVLHELDVAYRQIYTDGRPHTKDPEPSHMGYTTAKWDGDALVADTIGFTDSGWLDSLGHPHSDALHVVERFHRIDFGHLEILLTIDDPRAYKQPFTVVEKFTYVPDSDLLEYYCSDNEVDSAHYVVK